METKYMGQQRTFPKKPSVFGSSARSFKFGNKCRKTSKVKSIHSIFFESDGDYSENELQKEVKSESEREEVVEQIKPVAVSWKNVDEKKNDVIIIDDDSNDKDVVTNEADESSAFETYKSELKENRSIKKRRRSRRSRKGERNSQYDQIQNMPSEDISSKECNSRKHIKGENQDAKYESDSLIETSKADEAASSEILRKEESDFGNTDFREEIANIPMGKAKQLQERLGIKLFDKAFFNQNAPQSSEKKSFQKTFTRENPKRPREVSSKIPVSKFRNIFQNEKIGRPVCDPRFDDRFGEYNDYIYRTNYAFLNEIRQQEKKILMEELTKAKKEGAPEKDRLKEALRKMENQEKTQADFDRHKQIIREIRHENNQRMREGLPPVFKTRAQIRQLEWQKKYEELKSGNKLDKYLRRKAKKQDRKSGGRSMNVHQKQYNKGQRSDYMEISD